MKGPYIIAEIGSNWRHDIQIGKAQIWAAKKCGADAVKFQMYTHKDLYGTEGILKGGVTEREVEIFSEFCQQNNIDFLCSAFSADDFYFLNPYVKYHKIASCENEDPTIIAAVLNSDKKFFRSNGATFGLNRLPREIPMSCIAAYPAKAEDYSFKNFDETLDWGLSDHTIGIELAVTALFKGCMYFEKHFDSTPQFPPTADASVSFDEPEFADYCDTIRYLYHLKNITEQAKTVTADESDIVKYYKRRYIPEQKGFFRTKPVDQNPK
ncbi:MAG: N-acetylneuraminate synthase family protein [Candidatus Methylopumilus sp.]|nr:N-acetylneuraminate synthase family protein [Candidatus Methylopumilus sp.]